MPDLAEQLRTYVDGLAAGVEDVAPVTSRGYSGRRPLLLAAALLATTGAVAVAVVVADDAPRDDVTAATEPDALPPLRPEPQTLTAEWRELPMDGMTFGLDGALVWTGRDVLGFAEGDNGPGIDGWAYDPAAATTRRLPPGPIEGAVVAATWTAIEALVIGGPGRTDGAAFDPATDSWRPLTDAPAPVIGPVAWTGTELVVPASGLAFSPGTDSWRAIAASPLGRPNGAAVVAVGSRVLVWGGCDGDGCTETLTGDDERRGGALYDPATDSWEVLPDGPLAAGDNPTAVWTGSEVVVMVHRYLQDGARAAGYDPAARAWRPLPNPMRGLGRAGTTATWTGTYVVYTGGEDESRAPEPTGSTFAVDPADVALWTLADGPVRRGHTAVAVGTSGDIVVAGGMPSDAPWLVHLTLAG